MVKFGARAPLRWLLNEINFRPGRRPLRRIALVSDWAAWCSDQQYEPMVRFRSQLMAKHGISVMEFHLTDTGVFPPLPLGAFDYVMLKLSYRTSDSAAEAATRRIRMLAPNLPLIYMDGDDDICVQWGAVARIADVYVKAQAFRDLQHYRRSFRGKSNLHEYAVEEHDHVIGPLDYGNPGDEPLVIENSGTVGEADIPKLMVGWNMATASDILDLWDSSSSKANPVKTVDCVFRGSVKVGTITGYQRAAVQTRLGDLAKRFDIRFATQRVPLEEYYDELRSSRICVSPFGFGELCWRDFEAVLCRSLLIKPDMSHLVTYPDIYQPFDTYVPVKWDLSDLEEKCAHYLENHEERERIARNAYAVLDTYLRDFGFGDRLELILKKADAAISSTKPCADGRTPERPNSARTMMRKRPHLPDDGLTCAG